MDRLAGGRDARHLKAMLSRNKSVAKPIKHVPAARMIDPYAATNISYLRPAEIRRIMAAAPVAFVPVGPIEWHGEHLPTGVDALISYALVSRVAMRTGGVVLPALQVSCGLLRFPFSLCYSQQALERHLRDTLKQVRKEGFRAIVLLTGHLPMDQVHTLKSVCVDLMKDHPDCRAFGLGWFEMLVDAGEEMIMDHAAKVETSFMQALWPELVDVAALGDDPEEVPRGVYGKNPKFTASPEWGWRMIEHFVEKMAGRVEAMLRSEPVDNYTDLRAFVGAYWREPLTLGDGCRTTRRGLVLEVSNDSAYSRYVSGVPETVINGRVVSPRDVTFRNPHPGEGRSVRADRLSAVRGFYIRRIQTGTIEVRGVPPAEEYRVRLRLQLGGVAETTLEGRLACRSAGGAASKASKHAHPWIQLINLDADRPI